MRYRSWWARSLTCGANGVIAHIGPSPSDHRNQPYAVYEHIYADLLIMAGSLCFKFLACPGTRNPWLLVSLLPTLHAAHDGRKYSRV